MSKFGHVEAWLLLVHPDKVPAVGQVLSLSYIQSLTAFALLPSIHIDLWKSFYDILTMNGIKFLSNEEYLPKSLTTAMSEDKVEIVCVFLNKLYPDLTILDIITEACNQTLLDALLQKLCSCRIDPVPKTTHYMLQDGVTNIIEKLGRFGANMRYRSEIGTTFLHLAIKNRCEPLVQVLLSNGAYINALTEKYEAILHFAIVHGAPITMVKYFLEHGVNLNLAGGANDETPLLLGDVLDADVNACSMSDSVLELAVLKGAEYVARVLNLHPDLTNAPNRRAVWLAFERRFEGSIDLFLAYGFEPNLKDAGSLDALYAVVCSNRAEVVEKLLKLGGKTKIYLEVALRRAEGRISGKVLQLLVDYGVAVNIRSLLRSAGMRHNLDAVEWLQNKLMKDCIKMLNHLCPLDVTLPFEISSKILNFLSNNDLLNFSEVCKLPSDDSEFPDTQ